MESSEGLKVIVLQHSYVLLVIYQLVEKLVDLLDTMPIVVALVV